eukprot:TRINITY_DN1477_c2_g1_i2.p1 TRINITY_DN1477_c2_g1~~TRINITY_DN1477_c2_g1_i2.p1  ORF type:complete len:2138 (-),score=282.67 TRINITY_DN1477_c2_g1_i2:109-6522(-)
MSLRGFNFTEYLVRFANWKQHRLEITATNEYLVLNFDLMGLDNIWRCALEAVNPEVAQQASQLLNNVNKKLAPALSSKTLEYRERYIETCMSHIKTAFLHLAGAGALLRIQRCLTLLKTFITDLESGGHGHAAGVPIKIVLAALSGAKETIEVSSKETVGVLRQKAAERLKTEPADIRLIYAGKELPVDSHAISAYRIQDGHTVHIVPRLKDHVSSGTNASRAHRLPPPQETRLCPSTILSAQQYFEQLFELLNLDAFTAQMAWDLLMCLPTNSKLLQELRTFQSATYSAPVWSELLNPSSTFKLLYALQIVESEVTNEEGAKWCEGFVAQGGVSHLLHIFMSTDFLDEEKGSKRIVCLALLLKLANYFTLDHQPGGLHHKLRDPSGFLERIGPSVFINKLLEVSGKVAFAESEPGNSDSATVSVMKFLMQQFVACTVTSAAAQDALKTNPLLDSWLQTVLITCPDQDKRHAVEDALATICALSGELSGGIHTFMRDKLLTFLPRITPSSQMTYQYFDLLNKLITRDCESVPPASVGFFHNLIALLVQMLKKHPIVETQENVYAGFQDNVILGILKLLFTTVAAFGDLKERLGGPHGDNLMIEIFDKCLFDIPTIDSHEEDAPPKCKSQETRTAAFHVLLELCRGCDANFTLLYDRLVAQHHDGDERYWKYYPKSYERSMCGYVGLTNLTATCYMNSLMQQFYMIPGFRWSLLQAPDAAADKKDSTLYQLQSMMAGLQESVKRYVETRPFCASYKGYDGEPINVGQQQDADEFMNMLLEKLETLLKGTPQEKMLAQTLGGTLSNQFISRDCPHVSEREESFFALSLDIKNKKNITESLELYVQGDVLEGENKYACSQCNDKVDALKRCCISALPDNLVIHLKRFEFDLETMKRIKLNEHCVFPTNLNMEPYTKEGLARKEGRPIGDLPPRAPSYYQFELAGILVHSGTADWGHYYSFVKERIPRAPGLPLRWYHFNDTLVEPFDEQDIPKACYGGSDPVMEWDPMEGKQVQKYKARPNNAYILFYRRVEPIVDKPTELFGKDASALVPSPIYQSIWEGNTAFYHDKNIFDVDYFEFIWEIIMLHKHSVPIIDYEQTVDLSDPATKSIVLACKFLFETLSHAKETSMLPRYINQLKQLFSTDIPACKWFLESQAMDLIWMKDIFLECTVPATSELYAKLVVHIMSCLVPYEREKYYERVTDLMEVDEEEEDSDSEPEEQAASLVVRFLEAYVALIDDNNLARSWKRFGHYFMVLQDFAKLGSAERELFSSWRLLYRLGNFYLGAESPFLPRKKKKRAIPMGEKKLPPKLEFMIGLFSVLVRGCKTNIDPSAPTPPTQLPGIVLDMQRKDAKMIVSEVFWKKVLREGINPYECGVIIRHLAWENNDLSTKFIDLLTTGIHEADPEHFPPYFEVSTALLSIEDSLHHHRVDVFLGKFLVVIQNNLRYRTATQHTIKYLADIAPLLKSVREWLLTHMSQWIEPWLLASIHATVREQAELLVMSLVPRANPILIEETRKTNKAFVEEPLTEEDLAIITTIHERLLSLLSTTRRYKQNTDPLLIKGLKNSEDYPIAYWKLNAYFRLLKWCLRSDVQKDQFGKWFTEFSSIFQVIDDEHLNCDENKKELVLYWVAACEGHVNNVRLITESAHLPNRMFDFYAALNPGRDRMIIYNEETLPAFYRIIHLCCAESPEFLLRWSNHNNFVWATNSMYITNNLHPRCADSLYPIFALAAKLPEYRKKQLLATLKSPLAANPANLLRFYDLLLQTNKDAHVFSIRRGFDMFARYLHDHYPTSSPRKEDEPIPTELLLLAFRILRRAFAWLVAPSEKRQADCLSFWASWDTKSTFVDALFNIIERNRAHTETVDAAYQVIEMLAQVDASGSSYQQVLHRQQLHVKTLVELLGKKLRPEVTTTSWRSIVATQQLASSTFTRMKEDAGVAIKLADALLVSAFWCEASHASISTPPYSTLFSLIFELSASPYPIADALRESNVVPKYLGLVVQNNPQNALEGDMGAFVRDIVTHRQDPLDVFGIIDTLSTNGNSLAAQLISSAPNDNRAELAQALFHVVRAIHLFATPEEKRRVVQIATSIAQQLHTASDALLLALPPVPDILATLHHITTSTSTTTPPTTTPSSSSSSSSSM